VENVRTRRLVAVIVAGVVAVLDLGQKLIGETGFHHERSLGSLLVMAGVAIALVVVVPRMHSLPVVLGAGIAAGGAVGNLLSALAWGAGVPDPLVLGDVAFNLADLFVLAGDALLLTSAAVYALRNRDRLRQPL
jgi:lipoprotein signal peptidase